MSPDQPKARGTPQIPGYRIEAILGRGATGIVYRARQLSVDRVVALKVLHEELVGANSAARRLQREARTTARLAHPNIISAIDMGEVDGVWWYAMELVDGVSLAERLRDKRLSEREALRVFIPLCEALQHAFERGVVHRDIKPANILIERGGRALLVDLGLAVADDDPLLTKSGGTLGTPHYISPEQARDPASADVQSDLWSLGATLYHSVCGVPPFSGASVAEILSSVLYARIPDPAELAPQLSPGFVLVMRKCLTRDRERRYATPASLMADLERVRERRDPEIVRSALDPVARELNPWRRRLSLAGVALGVLLAFGGVWLATQAESGPQPAHETAATALDPLGEVAQGLESGARGPLAVLEDLDRVQATATLTPGQLARLDALRSRALQRLESEIWTFKREAEARFAQRLEVRDFAAADALTKGGLRRELGARLGSSELPPRQREDIELWTGRLYERLRQERQGVEEAFATLLDREYVERVVPEVETALESGRWRDARMLLTSDAERWIELVQRHGAGLSSAAQDRGLALLRGKLDARREVLDAAWAKLDRELVTLVAERVLELRGALDQRLVVDAPAALQQGWEEALAARALSIEQMPQGLLHLGHEELAKGARELAEHEAALALVDARAAFEVLDQETAPAWRDRRYGELLRLFEERAAQESHPALRDDIDLRRREARLLADVLVRADRGVRERDGKTLEMRSGTISLAGRVLAGVDPLHKGFVLALPGGQMREFALQAGGGAGTSQGTLVGSETLEVLAGLAPGVATEPADRLARALLRARDGDAFAARAALNSGPLPREEPLVRDLELRVANLLKDRKSVAGERRSTAEKRLFVLRRESQSGRELEKTRLRIEEFLEEFADVLLVDEMLDLRQRRDALFVAARPSTLAEFEAAYQPKSVQWVEPGRVRLEYEFQSAAAGAFDPGAWNSDGIGWSAPRYAKSDAELLSAPAPTLALRDPLRVQEETLEIRLRVEQFSDAPPELLLVSVAGFHVALIGAKEGRPARCLIDTSDAPDVLARARAGNAPTVTGMSRSKEHELRLVLQRSRGTASVELDGKRVSDGQRLLPRGDPADARLVIRSWEPVRLLEVTIEGARR